MSYICKGLLSGVLLESAHSNSDLIGLITSVVTLLLGIATVWMAFETRRMANAARDSVTLSTQPCLSVRSIEFWPGRLQFPTDPVGQTTPCFSAKLRLVNPGKVVVRYKITDTFLSMDSCGPYNPDYANTEGVIFPGEQIEIYFSSLKIIDEFSLKSKGSLRAKFKYWSTEQDKRELACDVSLHVTTLTPFACIWFHQEGSPFYR